MQQMTGKGAEPSMDDILASIRKIISEEPASLKSAGARAGAATTLQSPPVPSVAPPIQNAASSTSRQPSPQAPSARLSDLMRELAPSAVPINAPASHTYHDDMSDLVEGGTEVPVQTGRSSANGHHYNGSSGGNYEADSSSSAANSAGARSMPEFGAFVPQTVDSIRAATQRLQPASRPADLSATEMLDIKSLSPAPVVAPASSHVAATEGNQAEVVLPNAEVVTNPIVDTAAAAQSALGALAVGFAAPSNVALTAGAANNDIYGSAAASLAVRPTLEESIVSMLRPMLREWLDAHLPDMVEKALREEMAATGRSET
jgi:uncharacterized protein